MKSINEESLKCLYKVAHSGIGSIDNVIKMVEDIPLKEEIVREYEFYEKFAGLISKEMSARQIEPKELNIMQKAMMWSSIKLNTLTDDSRSHIADIMIRGTTTGLNDVIACLSKNGGIIDAGIKQIAEDMKAQLESFIEKLKKFL